MHPILLFAAILLVIWILGAIGNAINKQQEAERRRKLQQQMGQIPPPAATQWAPPPNPAERQINPGYAVRHPEMTRSSGAPRRTPQPALPRLKPPRAKQPKRPKKPVPVPPLPIPMLRADEAPRALAEPTPPIVAAVRSAAQSADAPAIKRWLNPATLRQQFILTEILQPPLAMRRDLHE